MWIDLCIYFRYYVIFKEVKSYAKHITWILLWQSWLWLKSFVRGTEYSKTLPTLCDDKKTSRLSKFRIKRFVWKFLKSTRRLALNLHCWWFCVGDPDFKGTINVNFIENAIATLNSQGEIKALWIKPVFRDDISLTI